MNKSHHHHHHHQPHLQDHMVKEGVLDAADHVLCFRLRQVHRG